MTTTEGAKSIWSCILISISRIEKMFKWVKHTIFVPWNWVNLRVCDNLRTSCGGFDVLLCVYQIRGIIGGRTSKTPVLSWFCKIEWGGGSGVAPAWFDTLPSLNSWQFLAMPLLYSRAGSIWRITVYTMGRSDYAKATENYRDNLNLTS